MISSRRMAVEKQDHHFGPSTVRVTTDRVYPPRTASELAACAYLTPVMQFSPSRPATVSSDDYGSDAKNTSDASLLHQQAQSHNVLYSC